MKLIAPNYYNRFKCIADKCRHNCCIGWEIDIDSGSLAYYKSLGGPFSERLKNSICEEEGTACFILSDDERCPFLNKKGLCDIIITLGENALCQICSDHPRFRNYFSDRTEIGLGLCCEEAASLILRQKDKMTLTVLSDDEGNEACDFEEESFFALREKLFSLAADRSKSINERLENLLSYCGISLFEKTNSELFEIFSKLEKLDKEWDNMLEMLLTAEESEAKSEEFEIAFEQLTVYFLYRHLSSFFGLGNTLDAALFTVVSVKLIMKLCGCLLKKQGFLNLDDICEVSRMFSSEIEYSDENIDLLLEEMKKE